MGKNIESMTLEQIWEHVLDIINKNPEPFKNASLRYQITLTGQESGSYILTLENGVAKLDMAEDENAPCQLKMDSDQLKKLLLGKLNSTAAYMTGKLKVKGNIGLALKLESLLKKYQFE